jgi:hypothetical protein
VSGSPNDRDTPTEPQFALFSGDNYYPLGGWDDYIDTYRTLDEAKTARRPADDWAHVVDLLICEVVAKYQKPFGWSS